MDLDFWNDEPGFVLNIPKCLASYDTMHPIKRLLRAIQAQGYITVGEYFQSLTDEELELLRELTVEEEYLDELAMHNLAILTMGLVVGNGDTVEEELLQQHLQIARTYISLEFLARNDLIDVYHENWCMDINSELPACSRRKK